MLTKFPKPKAPSLPSIRTISTKYNTKRYRTDKKTWGNFVIYKRQYKRRYKRQGKKTNKSGKFDHDALFFSSERNEMV